MSLKILSQRMSGEAMAKTVFYARVSTKDQNLNAQVDAARRLGVEPEQIYVEKASGARHDRPQLAKALAALKQGDTLACFKLDRIGRSLPHLVSILEDLEKRGIHFITTEDGLSTKGSTGKFVLNIMAAVAQFERSLILERTRAGLAAAKVRGKLPGRRRVMEPTDVVRARKLLDAGELSSHDVAAMLKVSRATMFRELRRVRDVKELEGSRPE
jgi:DNA invertase Pin-like site-specific DNA recombinase